MSSVASAVALLAVGWSGDARGQVDQVHVVDVQSVCQIVAGAGAMNIKVKFSSVTAQGMQAVFRNNSTGQETSFTVGMTGPDGVWWFNVPAGVYTMTAFKPTQSYLTGWRNVTAYQVASAVVNGQTVCQRPR